MHSDEQINNYSVMQMQWDDQFKKIYFNLLILIGGVE